MLVLKYEKKQTQQLANSQIQDMTLSLRKQSGADSRFLDLLNADCDRNTSYYFVLCGRFNIGVQRGRVLLHDSLVTESQKINTKRTVEANGQIARDQWTLVLKFNQERWQKFKKATGEREVYLECLFKKPGRNPTFAPICAFPTIGKRTAYSICANDLQGDAFLGFRRGGIKINHKKDGSVVMLIRLEERGYIPLYHYVIDE